MPEEPTPPLIPVDEQSQTEGLTAEDIANQPEDDDPLALAGDEADAPADSGRPEGVGP